jgi:hypothetical protein
MAKQPAAAKDVQTVTATVDTPVTPPPAAQPQDPLGQPAQPASPPVAKELSDAPPDDPSVFDSGKVITSGGAAGNGTSNAELSAAAAVSATPVPQTPDTVSGLKRKWHVSCHPDTPLAYPEFDCEAASAEEAETLFFQANGISATHRERTITPME